MDFNPKKIKSLIERRHPEYADKKDHWCFLYDTYLGGRDWYKGNIFQFNREGIETYRGRLMRAYRYNHTREVVDLVSKYLFQTPPARSEDPSPQLEQFRTCATMSGLSLNEFERQVGTYASIFGRVYVVVDNSIRGDNAPDTIAEERQLGNVLYSYVVLPMDFLDCSYDRLGQYSWALIREHVRDDADPFNSTGEVSDVYRLWTTTNWYLFTVDQRGKAVLLEQGVHDLGCVPVVRCDHIESDEKYAVPALIENIAYLDRAVANYLSNLDQIINDQTFSQLVMPARAVLAHVPQPNPHDPDDPDHEMVRKNLVALGTSQILTYDAEGGAAPAYINPDPNQAGVILDTIKQIINEIYHTVGLAGERTKQDNSLGIDNSSGIAKAFDFERVNSLLSAKANAMQCFSNRLETLIRIYAGETITLKDRGVDTVIYPMNFDVRTLIEDLSIANEMALIQGPIEVRRVQLKGIVQKMWPMMPAADMKKLENSIDQWTGVDDNLLAMGNSGTSKVSNNLLSNNSQPGQGAVGGEDAASNAGKRN